MTSELSAWTREFYRRSMTLMNDAGLPFMVGGAYALARYTGIERHTKDLDLHIRPTELQRTLHVFDRAGYHAEATFPHCLAKIHDGDAFIDLIYRSGNGLSEVDDQWFQHAVEGEVLGVRVLLCPAEEMIWAMAFVQERERYDGADVAHLLVALADRLDWDRLVQRFGRHWRVLMGHLVLFGYIYPNEQSRVPRRILNDLLGRLAREAGHCDHEAPTGSVRFCQGTFLSREQYLVDVEHWGYRDARLAPGGTMTPGDVAQWTAAIESSRARECATASAGPP
jgi:hypothetical protein